MKISKVLYPFALVTAISCYRRKAFMTAVVAVVALSIPTLSAEEPPTNADTLRRDNNKNKNTYSSRKLEDLVPDKLKSTSSNLKQLFESGVPHQIGYGFMMGYSSGFCLKKVSKVVAFTLGGVFILIQTLSYSGYINVHYSRLQKDVESLLDINKDGKFDEHDIQYCLIKVKEALEYQMPAGGGFTTGLLLGLRG